MKRTIFLFLSTLCLLVLCCCTAPDDEPDPVDLTDPILSALAQYEEDSGERFSASYALTNGIDFESAVELVPALDWELEAQEEVRYKSLDKLAGTITSADGYRQDVRITTEIRYIYDTSTKDVVAIEHLGFPYLYLPGVSQVEGNDSEYNQEMNPDGGRLSRTTVLTYIVMDSVKASNSIAAVAEADDKFSLTTQADTYVLEFTPDELLN